MKLETKKVLKKIIKEILKEQMESDLKVGDMVQVMDLEENTYVVPKVSRIQDVDEYLGSDGDMHFTYEINNEWYEDENYSIIKY